MPCRDGGDERDDLRERLNAATRAACELARFVREANSFSKLSEETREWVNEHDKIDAERIKREQEERERKELKKQALKKLTREEREALNI